MSIYRKKIGLFELSVSDPSPAWIEISFDGASLVRMHPDYLHDLEYVAECARRELNEQEANRKRLSGSAT